MHTSNHKKLKAEIENYRINGKNILESRMDNAFSMLKFKTQLNRTKTKKNDGLSCGASTVYIDSIAYFED